MKYSIVTFLFFFLFPLTVFASHSAKASPEIKILNLDGFVIKSFESKPFQMFGGATVAANDLGRDSIAEIITGSGFGEKPQVNIFRQDGSLINSFLAYAPTFDRGIRVAVADVDGDGLNEIVTGAGYGGGAHIRIFDPLGNPKGKGFFAFDNSFAGGAFIAAKDLDNDSKAEIIVGAGPTGGPHIKIFDYNGRLKNEFFAFDKNDASGVTIGVADIYGSGKPVILVGRASSDPPEVKIFTSDGREIKSFLAFDRNFTGGVTPTGFDINNDGHDEIIVSPNGKNQTFRIFDSDGLLVKDVSPFDKNFTGSIQLAPVVLNPQNDKVFIVTAGRAYREGQIGLEKSITVSLSQQRLYAYERGLLKQSYLISSGVKKYPTPIGSFTVQKKIPLKNYTRTYGPGNPNNYNFKDVKWNLQFLPGYYLHYAYWHNNFGHPMSHGCVNMSLASSEWIYSWSDVGTPVIVYN